MKRQLPIAIYYEHPEWFRPLFDFNQSDVVAGAFAVGSSHFVNRTLFVAQGQIHQREIVGMDIT